METKGTYEKKGITEIENRNGNRIVSLHQESQASSTTVCVDSHSRSSVPLLYIDFI